MRCSIYAAAAALLLYASTAVAGGPEVTRASYRNSSTSFLRGGSPGCGCGVSMAPTCDSGCGISFGDPCQPACCPKLLPSLMSGLDGVLQRLYYNPCNIPCCRPRLFQSTCCTDIWQGYNPGCGWNPGCGCGSGGSGEWPVEKATNPFVDDELQLPPPVPKDARIRHPAPKSFPAKHRLQYSSEPTKVAPVKIASVSDPIHTVPRPAVPARTVEHRRLEYSSEPTTVAPVQVASVSDTIQPVPVPAVAASVPARPVKQVKHETPSKRIIPKNPLRDE